MSKKIRVLNIVEDTMVDGPGLRTSIYCAGCAHACKGCHNPQSWDFKGGTEMTTDEIMERILANKFDDVTFSGGDPMYQAEAFAELAQKIKHQTQKTIWCYTGFLYEQVIEDNTMRKLLELVDVLVDGEFIEEQRDIQIRFRGSRNQRLIDIRKSLEKGEVVLWKHESAKI